MDQNTTDSDFGKIKARLVESVDQNVAESNTEPNIFIKNPKEVAKTEAPMQMEGSPDIKTPKAKEESLIIKYETDKGIESQKIVLRRLTVAKREAIALIIMRMMQALNIIDETGFDMRKLDETNIESAMIMAQYLRQLAPYMVDYPQSFWDNVSFSELTKLLDWLFKNEINLIKTIEDFLSMKETTTKR